MTSPAFRPGTAPPVAPATAEFRLEPLGPHHNEADHAAWTSSIDHIRSTPGSPGGNGATTTGPCPCRPRTTSVTWCGMRTSSPGARRSPTPCSTRPDGDVIGCVYIDPDDTGAADAMVRSWVRADRAHLDAPLARRREGVDPGRVATGVGAVPGAPDMTRWVLDPEASQVWIEGSSSVHPIRAGATGLTGWVELSTSRGKVATDPGLRGEVRIAVDRLQSGNPLVDRETRRRVDARRFPEIVGTVTAATREATDQAVGDRTDRLPGRVPGRLG